MVRRRVASGCQRRPSRESTSFTVCSALLLGLLTGCSSELPARGGQLGSEVPPEPTGPSSTLPGSSPTTPPVVPGEPVTPLPGEELPSPFTRAARLTHQQWVNTVNDLFEIDSAGALAASFRIDPRQGGFLFDNESSSLVTDEALFRSFQSSAVELARLVTQDTALLARVLPASAAADPTAFIEAFGARVHRRPLTPQEVSEYQALHASAAGKYPDEPDAFKAGVRLVLEAFLQSPYFLYRVEESQALVGRVIPLSSYEVASRLSYSLWNSMPDTGLFAAAAQGLDAAKAKTEALRLLSDARAAPVLGQFHAQLFDERRFQSINPSPTAFPEAPAGLGAFATEESSRFSMHVLFDQAGGFTELITSTQTFVNAELAGVYGLSGSYDNTFQLAQLNAQERQGVLTQVGFLASHATSQDPDPIHRGVFIANRLLCLAIAAPPVDIPPLPAAGQRTNRENVASLTEEPGTACAACHAQLINPLGFAFEHYDAMGGFRTMDNGHPVDASVSVPLGEGSVAVKGAVEFAVALAASEKAHECYAKRLSEFVFGRAVGSLDANLLSRLGGLSLVEKRGVKELIAELVASQAFAARSVEELP